MQYIETATSELKREVTEEIKKEIVAFLNTHGGTIYVGVADDGTVFWNLSEKQKDIEQTKIIHWISGGVLSPDCKECISLEWNKDGVLEIHVAEGLDKPYYLSDKGCTSKGVFIRFESSKMPASKEDITRMKMESRKTYYEDQISTNQNLHFTYLNKKLWDLNIECSYLSFGFLKEGQWTNLAYLFSDDLKLRTKLFFVDAKNNVLKKIELKKSILSQIDAIIPYFKDSFAQGYSYDALYEGLLNAFMHRNWSLKEHIRIEWSPTKINFISPGGIYQLSLEEAQSGKTSYRNPKLIKMMKKMGYSKQYSKGLDRIYSCCKQKHVEPILITTNSLFILSIPKERISRKRK